MMTLRLLAARPPTIPTAAAWSIADIAEARGKQELFTRQAPQTLAVLREHALIESALSSTRIEGVEIDQRRASDVVLGQSRLADRNEEEVRGYRDALKLIHEQASNLAVTEATIKELHLLVKPGTGDAGAFKAVDTDIVERLPSGRTRIRFSTTPAAETPSAVAELLSLMRMCQDERWLPHLAAVAAFNLDFLCIHPFRDGNGRVSRLLFLLQTYSLGYEVGRYISLERLIETHKDRYYETLEESSHRWHEGRHDPWPFINYMLFIVHAAYREFESRVGGMVAPRGAKTEQLAAAIAARRTEFTLAELERACPGVSRDMIRKLLRRFQAEGAIECLGRGPGARWRKRVVPQ
jgi:Fic family protein